MKKLFAFLGMFLCFVLFASCELPNGGSQNNPNEDKNDSNSSSDALELSNILINYSKKKKITINETTSGCLINGNEVSSTRITNVDFDNSYFYSKINDNYSIQYNNSIFYKVLNEKYTLSNKQFPHLKTLINKDLIVTDGEHLLGGDDKAGIAIIMSIVEYYQTHKDINHAPIRICFTPDEEIGAGADHFSTTKMDADVAYTVDGGNYNEINIENFNASSAEVIIKGVGIHPGEAKDIMVNAILLAMEFNSLLNPNAIPSKTSGKEGFNHLENISGDVEECKMSYILRNHDDILLKEQEQSLLIAKEIIERKYPTCKIHVHIKEQYKNMVYYFEKDDKAVKLIQKAFNKCKKEYEFVAVRGGTDGARITYMGLPCPNIGTGDRCCHGRYEHVVINELYEMFEIITTLLEL